MHESVLIRLSTQKGMYNREHLRANRLFERQGCHSARALGKQFSTYLMPIASKNSWFVMGGIRPKRASAYASKLRLATEDPEDFSHFRPADAKLLTCSPRTVHTPQSVKRFAATPPGEVESISRFLRLHPDGICNTLWGWNRI